MKGKRFICILLIAMLVLALAACGTSGTESKEKVTLTIKTTPIGLGNIPDVGEAEVYDLFVAAAEKFKAQYDKYDVEFDISRYDYLDEKEQLADKYGTEDAADIFFAGSYNVPAYVESGWLEPLDDIIDEEAAGRYRRDDLGAEQCQWQSLHVAFSAAAEYAPDQ